MGNRFDYTGLREYITFWSVGLHEPDGNLRLYESREFSDLRLTD